MIAIPARRRLIALPLATAGLTCPCTAAADGDVIVRLGHHASAHRLAAAGVRATVGSVAGTGARLVRVTGDPAAVAARLARIRGVAWAEPNLTVHALGD